MLTSIVQTIFKLSGKKELTWGLIWGTTAVQMIFTLIIITSMK